MTNFKVTSKRTSASESKKTVSKSTTESWDASGLSRSMTCFVTLFVLAVKVKTASEKLKADADDTKNKAVITGAAADKKQFAKWKTAKTDAAAKIAQDKEEAAQLKAEADAAAAAAADAAAPAPEGRRLLNVGVTGGGTNSQESEVTTEEADSASDALSNSVMKFYGCTPSADPIAWCSSCAASPVAIRYSMVPISTLISQVTRSSFR